MTMQNGALHSVGWYTLMSFFCEQY